MSNADVSHNLQQLIRSARATTNNLLKVPLAINLTGLAATADELLKGLRSSESLTGFHPFADLSCPEADARTTETVSRRKPESHQPGAGSGKAPEKESTVERTDSVPDAASLQNLAFTELVEQLFCQLPAPSRSQPASRDGGHNGNRISQGARGRSLAVKDSLPEVHNTAGRVQKAKPEEDKAAEGFPGRAVSEQSCPAFQQLRELVSSLESKSGGRQPQHASAAGGDMVTPKSHLADLTRILVKGNMSGKTGSGPQIKNNAGQPGAGPGHSSAEASIPLKRQEGAAADSEINLSRKQNPFIAEQIDAPVYGAADRLRRNPNLEIAEHAVTTAPGVHNLSPMAAQRMAEALNDYLQEQAEHHGVDLS
ncbi:MAG: hypothetical protein R3208_16720 [Ketobacteraceae bacterium]|nr:hypothetical protein [Ketobacteraceae bacterium]